VVAAAIGANDSAPATRIERCFAFCVLPVSIHNKKSRQFGNAGITFPLPIVFYRCYFWMLLDKKTSSLESSDDSALTILLELVFR